MNTQQWVWRRVPWKKTNREKEVRIVCSLRVSAWRACASGKTCERGEEAVPVDCDHVEEGLRIAVLRFPPPHGAPAVCEGSRREKRPPMYKNNSDVFRIQQELIFLGCLSASSQLRVGSCTRGGVCNLTKGCRRPRWTRTAFFPLPFSGASELPPLFSFFVFKPSSVKFIVLSFPIQTRKTNHFSFFRSRKEAKATWHA